jgi:predicted NAD/FAD-binding protein
MKIAVVGSGISGLACALELARSRLAAVTLIEAAPTLGGHSHTIDVTVDGITHPVDTGFLVFNHRTYPNLVRLFDDLAVPTAASDMSFSVSLGGAIEWAGTNLATVFAQPSNLLRPRFLGMLADILRFNREAGGDAPLPDASLSLGDYLEQHRYGTAFRDWYLLPMAAAIWSCPARTMLDYPFATFAQFCRNHGLLQVADRPQWHTVAGGSREYVRRIAARLDDVRLATPVTAVRPTAAGVLVHMDVQGKPQTERFDRVVLACHSDQSAALLPESFTVERELLGRIGYQPNVAWLHTDTALMPRRRRVWAAWNYLAPAPHSRVRHQEHPVAVSYLINKLQPLPFTSPVMVTLNPSAPPADAHVIRRLDYAHPVFDAAAVDAQKHLDGIQGREQVWYAGAWCGYGFHEDGLKAGLAVAARLGDELRGQKRAA